MEVSSCVFFGGVALMAELFYLKPYNVILKHSFSIIVSLYFDGRFCAANRIRSTEQGVQAGYGQSHEKKPVRFCLFSNGAIISVGRHVDS